MDWKLVASAFGAIFLAELGDKTQLAAISLAASSNRPLSVFAGASAALLTVSLLGVLLGAALTDVLPLAHLRTAGAVAFIAVGTAILLGWL